MTEPPKIRVAIVDDHAVVRGGLRLFLLAFDDLELVGEASNGKKALALCEQAQPDVVLMDLVMPEMNGIEATKAIRARYPNIQVVALTSFPEEELVRGALDAGSVGYLLKNASAGDLSAAIRAAHAGQATLAPEATEALIHGQQMVEPLNLVNDLTPREREVLSLMVEGISNAKIAEKLVISHSTVKFHVSNILSKLGVSSRAEAIALTLKKRRIE
jgi:NarL family two-component system response regulator LiaR